MGFPAYPIKVEHSKERRSEGGTTNHQPASLLIILVGWLVDMRLVIVGFPVYPIKVEHS